jgi:FkbM family methyltransferase
MASPIRRMISRALRRAGLRGFNGKLLGQRFVIPRVGDTWLDLAEPWMPPLLERLFPLRSGAFVDVGVNLGQTLLVAVALDRGRRYVGFEPNPSCVSYAARLIEANHLANCRLVPAGLSDRTELVALDVFHEDTDSAASMVQGFRPGQEVRARKDVAVFNPADLPPDVLLSPIGIVKIDVEGAEKEVLSGLAPILRRDRPLVVVEVLPAYSEDNDLRLPRQRSIEQLLGELDYRILRLSHAPLFATRIPEFGVHGDLSQCDYVLAPSELADAVEAALAPPQNAARAGEPAARD